MNTNLKRTIRHIHGQSNMLSLRVGFTLIELLMVIAIIAVLIALLVPAVQKVRETAARAHCLNNLKQIGIALQSYHDVKKAFPPGYQASASYVDGATDTAPGWGWAAFVLPYLEKNVIAGQLALQQPVERSVAIQTMLPVYLCPSDLVPISAVAVPDAFGNTIALAGPTSYAACVGGDESSSFGPDGQGVFYRNSAIRITDISDGTSNTILVGERSFANAQGIWAGAVQNGVCLRGLYNPCPGGGAASYPAATLVQAHAHLNNTNTDTDGGLDDFSSQHPGGANFLFADGSVRFLRSQTRDNPDGSYTADDLMFQALGTRAQGDVVPGAF
jgi:prepilin-type processing-associated H-X9-DG protein/prepilin-type N-terminal cleavage/methylation domain-containing protein